MAKVIYLCDVKSCTHLAENEILLRRDKLRVCQAHSFVSFRSPEYRKWKALQRLYKLPIQNLKIMKTFSYGLLTVL